MKVQKRKDNYNYNYNTSCPYCCIPIRPSYILLATSFNLPIWMCPLTCGVHGHVVSTTCQRVAECHKGRDQNERLYR